MEFPLSLVEWLLAAGVVIVAAVVQGSIGFGVALLAAPLLYLIDPRFVPAPVIVISLALNVLVYAREREAVDPFEVGRVLVGVVLGTVAAALVLRMVSPETLGLLFGVLVLLAVGLSIGLRPPEPGWRLLVGAGGLAGFMGTATSIGGPPLALVFQRRHGTHLRGTLAACFLPSSLLSLAALYWAGHFGATELVIGLSLFPAVVAGFRVSYRTAGLLDGRWLRGAVLAVSALAGAAAIARALW